MEISFTRTNDWTVVTVAGRLDTISATEFDLKLGDTIAQGEHRLVLDFSRLEYVSSAGLRSVIAAAKSANSRGGSVCCCGLTGVVKRVFEVSGFTTLLPIFETVDHALAQ